MPPQVLAPAGPSRAGRVKAARLSQLGYPSPGGAARVSQPGYAGPAPPAECPQQLLPAPGLPGLAWHTLPPALPPPPGPARAVAPPSRYPAVSPGSPRPAGQRTRARPRGQAGTRSRARSGARQPRQEPQSWCRQGSTGRPGSGPRSLTPTAAPTESGGGASAFMCDPEPTRRGRGGGGRNREGRLGRPQHRPGRCRGARSVPGRSPRGARGCYPWGQSGARPGHHRRVALRSRTTFPSEPQTGQAGPARGSGAQAGTSFPAVPRAPEAAARRFRGGGPGQRRQAAAGGAPGGGDGRDRARDRLAQHQLPPKARQPDVSESRGLGAG